MTAAAGARHQVNRLLALVPYLRARESVSVEEAAREFGVRPATIRRDINVLMFCGLPGGGMTGVVPGSGTGAGTAISGVLVCGGRMTPSDCSSLSLSVEPVDDGSCAGTDPCGSTFSGGICCSGGMLGACWFSTLGF